MSICRANNLKNLYRLCAQYTPAKHRTLNYFPKNITLKKKKISNSNKHTNPTEENRSRSLQGHQRDNKKINLGAFAPNAATQSKRCDGEQWTRAPPLGQRNLLVWKYLSPPLSLSQEKSKFLLLPFAIVWEIGSCWYWGSRFNWCCFEFEN